MHLETLVSWALSSLSQADFFDDFGVSLLWNIEAAEDVPGSVGYSHILGHGLFSW